MPIRGLIFDFDGLILDTETPLYQAWTEIYAQHGLRLPLEKYSACIGSTFEDFDPSKYLEQLTGKPLNHPELHAGANQRGQALLQQQALRSGFPEIFQEARRMGIRLAVASSSTRKWVLGNLQHRNLSSYFDAVKTAEDVERVKPDPALYLSALRALGLDAGDCLALEDSTNGVSAALAAGLRCIAVPNPVTRSMRLDHASLILDDLGAWSLADIISRFESDGFHG